MKNHLKLFVVGLLFVCSFPSIAKDQYSNEVSLICCSWHHDRNRYNEQNLGIAYTKRFDKGEGLFDHEWYLFAGSYQNSFDRNATFVGYGEQMFEHNGIKGYWHIGLATGYPNKVIGQTSVYGLFRFKYKRLNVETVPGVVYALSVDIARW